MGGPVKQMVDGTTLAVGDAAGLVMPSNGGGISQAIISGCFAAEAIVDHITNKTPLSSLRRQGSCIHGPSTEELASEAKIWAMPSCEAMFSPS